MKRTRKAPILIISATLLLLLAGCGDGGTSIADGGSVASSATTSEVAKEIKVEKVLTQFYYDPAFSKPIEQSQINGLASEKTFFVKFSFVSFNSTFLTKTNLSITIHINNTSGFTFNKDGATLDENEISVDDKVNNGKDVEIKGINILVDPGPSSPSTAVYFFSIKSSTGLKTGDTQAVNIHFLSSYGDTFNQEITSQPFTFVGSDVSKLLLLEQDVQLDKNTGVISWKAVADADKYYLEDGTQQWFRNLNEPFYPIDRSKDEGKTKTVKLYATSYSIEHGDSEPVAITYTVLARPNFSLNKSAASYSESYTIAYEGVDGAEDYVLCVDGSDALTLSATGTIDLAKTLSSYKAGVHNLTLYSRSSKANVISSVSSLSKDFRLLAAPKISLDKRTINWDHVDGADTYLIYVNGVYHAVTHSANYSFLSSDIPFGSKLTVVAYSDETYTIKSAPSNEIVSDLV